MSRADLEESDCEHEGSGTVEFLRGNHRSMRCSGAQTLLRFRPLGTGEHVQNLEVLTEGDRGTDPAQYSADHVEVRGKAGTIVAFQIGCWHRAPPLGPQSIGRPPRFKFKGKVR